LDGSLAIEAHQLGNAALFEQLDPRSPPPTRWKPWASSLA
jgi:hypothetical protein